MPGRPQRIGCGSSVDSGACDRLFSAILLVIVSMVARRPIETRDDLRLVHKIYDSAAIASRSPHVRTQPAKKTTPWIRWLRCVGESASLRPLRWLEPVPVSRACRARGREHDLEAMRSTPSPAPDGAGSRGHRGPFGDARTTAIESAESGATPIATLARNGPSIERSNLESVFERARQFTKTIPPIRVLAHCIGFFSGQHFASIRLARCRSDIPDSCRR
jgi:hypothetical protein